MNVEISLDYSQYNNGKMNLQEIINKYEARNKSRIERLKTEERVQTRLILLNLYNETEEIINNLKGL